MIGQYRRYVWIDIGEVSGLEKLALKHVEETLLQMLGYQALHSLVIELINNLAGFQSKNIRSI